MVATMTMMSKTTSIESFAPGQKHEGDANEERLLGKSVSGKIGVVLPNNLRPINYLISTVTNTNIFLLFILEH
jgi:hypothetical protein